MGNDQRLCVGNDQWLFVGNDQWEMISGCSLEMISVVRWNDVLLLFTLLWSCLGILPKF